MNNINLHILQATGRLHKSTKDLERLTKETVEKVVRVLPICDIDIIIQDKPEYAIEHIAIGGYTPDVHTIYISLDPGNKNFFNNLQSHMGRQLAHELHHTLRWKNPGYGLTLFEAIISEGLADIFSYEVFPGEIEKWDKALSDKQVDEIKKRAEKEWFRDEYDHNEWFFGTNSEIPRWAGYTLGFVLVMEYLRKHPKETVATLSNKDAKEFV